MCFKMEHASLSDGVPTLVTACYISYCMWFAIVMIRLGCIRFCKADPRVGLGFRVRGKWIGGGGEGGMGQ